MSVYSPHTHKVLPLEVKLDTHVYQRQELSIPAARTQLSPSNRLFLNRLFPTDQQVFLRNVSKPLSQNRTNHALPLPRLQLVHFRLILVIPVLSRIPALSNIPVLMLSMLSVFHMIDMIPMLHMLDLAMRNHDIKRSALFISLFRTSIHRQQNLQKPRPTKKNPTIPQKRERKKKEMSPNPPPTEKKKTDV